jgi:predicted DNA binding CopG/RHH family protein
MVVKMKKVKLDKFEQKIEDNLENFVTAPATSKIKIDKIINKANEHNRVTLRINNQDLQLLKSKAKEEGLPYQTLISSILHKYALDKLIDEKSIIKSLNLLK